MATENDPRVRVAFTDIQRQLEKNGHHAFYLLFALDGVDLRFLADGMTAAEAAMRHANAVVPAESVEGESVEPSPYGPMVVLDLIGVIEDTNGWLTAFAAHLQAAGWSGSIEPAPRTGLPRGLDRDRGVPRMTAFLAYRHTESLLSREGGQWRRRGWAVDPDTTDVLCRDLIEWGSFEGADTYLSQGRSEVRLDDQNVQELLVWTAHQAGRCGVTYARKAPLRVHSAQLSSRGQVTVQVEDEQLDWRTRLDNLTWMLSRQADKMDLGFIRLSPYWALSWIALGNGNQPLACVDEADVRNNRQLWDRYIPDAHGIQLLTADHLSRAHTLADWDVRSLAPDRYLVRAKDLGAWYAGTRPDPEVLTSARMDFAGLLLTPKVIKG
ncbi:MAG TPA: hypothetical protein VLL08_29210 [Kineosporiaceae bacterium]|nr:hypothetical protein [Kineosporiaceae bacterium]